MDDFIVYENFLPVVRKSLYGATPSRVKENHGNKVKQSKKVKFGTDEDSSDLESQNSQMLKNRKATPFKKKLKKVKAAQNGDGSGKKISRKYKKAVTVDLKKKKPKRNKVVISFSNSSESSNDEEQLTPSKSEMEIFQNTFNKPKGKSCNGNDSTSDDESSDNFDLETYFNTRDISDLNESITEAHSGIDHEFVNEYAKNVKIFESESVKGCKHKEETTNDNNSSLDSEKYFIDDSISGDENITSITEKIQESMIISDEDYVETSFNTVTQEEQHQDQEEEIPNEYCSAEYYEFEDKKIVVLNENQSVSFHGLFKLKVLHGKIDIVGHVLDKNSKEVDLYSPRGSALLCVKNVTQNESCENNLESIYGISLNCGHAAFLCTKLEDSKIIFIEKYIPQKLFPKLDDNMPQVCFESTENLNVLKSTSAWNKILDNTTSNTKLMITGGKGVGKSTLLRFMINKLLNTFPKVKVLDLDPGQSEFAVPGCLSVVTVTKPVFGPNFTHLRPTDRSLLSNINVGHDPRAYLRCIRSLMLYLESLEEECPLLINYMGFVQGIGLNIISTAIKDIRPTDIIQIQSKNNNRNFKADLTPTVVETSSKLFSENNKTHLDYSELKYKLHKVPAMNDGNDGWTLEPRQSREMYVLAYFGQMMQNGVNSLTSHELPMYEIKLSEIKITNLKGEEIIPAAANANMVALCSLQEDSNIFVCFGYGIIRGIDLGCNKLVLVTPEPANVLEEVYYLVIASVSLPPSIYMTPDDVTGIVPYVMEGELVSLGQITKRSYLPVNKK